MLDMRRRRTRMMANNGGSERRIIVLDSFDRADNAASLGTAPTGQAWSALNGTWGISNNRAYCVTDVSDPDVAVVDSGVPDCSVQVTFAVNVSNPRLVFRCTDKDNLLLVQPEAGSYKLYQRQAGVYTRVGPTASLTAAAGDVVRARLRGPAIDIFINNVLRISGTSAFNQTATKHGLGALAGSVTGGVRYEDFRVMVP